jgi:hypothetical protein
MEKLTSDACTGRCHGMKVQWFEIRSRERFTQAKLVLEKTPHVLPAVFQLGQQPVVEPTETLHELGPMFRHRGGWSRLFRLTVLHATILELARINPPAFAPCLQGVQSLPEFISARLGALVGS